MIISIRENRRMLGERKTMRDRSDGYSYEKSAPLEFNDSMTTEEHEKHQMEWRLRRRRSRIKMGIFLGTLVLIMSVWLIWLGM